MSIIFGIISLLVAISMAIAASIYMNFEIIHFNFFFIIPVGALAVGVLAGFGYYKGLVLAQKKITGKHLLIGLIMGIICLGAIKYGTYKLTCINPQTGGIEYTLDGDHISNYELEDYGPMTFVNFNRFVIESTPVSFSYRRREIGEVNNKTFSWILAIIDYLGVIFGCAIAQSFAEGNKRYCDTCKRYMKYKTLFKVGKEDGPALFQDLEALLTGDSSYTNLKAIEEAYPGKSKEYYQINICYCEECHHSLLVAKLFEKVSHTKYGFNDDFAYEKEIPHHAVKDYIA